jgi:hypothetical protein
MADEIYNRPGFRPTKADLGGDDIILLPAQVAETWVAGDMLALSGNTNGSVILATAASTHLIGPAVDARNATAAGELVPVYADPDMIFEGLVSANASGLVIGDQVDLIGASGAQLIDVGASATDVFTFLGLLPDETATAARAKAKVRITETKHGLR